MNLTNVRINDNLEPLLKQFTHDSHHTKTWVINEALRVFFESKRIQEKRWKGVLQGINDVTIGDVVDGDSVDAWLASWGTENEHDAP